MFPRSSSARTLVRFQVSFSFRARGTRVRYLSPFSNTLSGLESIAAPLIELNKAKDKGAKTSGIQHFKRSLAAQLGRWRLARFLSRVCNRVRYSSDHFCPQRRVTRGKPVLSLSLSLSFSSREIIDEIRRNRRDRRNETSALAQSSKAA